MRTISFRYTEDIDTIVSDFGSSREICFKQNNQTLFKVLFKKYFYAIEFPHDIFGKQNFGLNYVRMTAKDGSAFLARIYINRTFYVIRKKKKKPQIVFARSGDCGIKNFQLGKDVFDAVCFYNGSVTKDEKLIDDFFEKRPIVEFDEQKYIDSLDSEERKEYLEDKKIEEVIGLVGKKNKIEKERIEDLIFFVQCMPDESDIKSKVLHSNDIEEITSLTLPLIKKVRENSEKTEASLCVQNTFEKRGYSFDRSFIYSNNDLSSIDLKLAENEWYVEDLFYFFEDEYEQVKEYLNKGMERVKKVIDKTLPFFKQYIEDIMKK